MKTPGFSNVDRRNVAGFAQKRQWWALLVLVLACNQDIEIARNYADAASQVKQDAETCAVIRGVPLTDGLCVPPLVIIECQTPPFEECNDAAMVVHDPSGECWWFPNNCIPEGWTEAYLMCEPTDGYDFTACIEDSLP